MDMLSFDDLYPEELLQARERKLRGFWAGNGPSALLSIHAGGEFPVRQLEDDDLVVNNAVQQILASAHLSEDYLPWFGPDFGTVSTAVYWGGEEILPEGGCAFIKPIIHDPHEAALLPKPINAAGAHVAHAVALAARVKERLGSERIWCRSIDLQGPLSTAALLWEQGDFFCSMLTDSEAVHGVLAQVTDQLIAMVQAMKQGMGPICGPTWPYIWLPDDLGFGFTEDLMPLVSPAQFKEFGIPYMTRLAEACGGAFIHCCGEFEQHLENLATCGAPILGFDYCEPHTRTEAVYEAFGPSMVYHVGISPLGEARWGDHAGFIEQHLCKIAPCDMRFWFCIDTAFPDAARRANVARRLMLDR